jgi:phosphoribosylamine-glycine ligase
MGDDLAAARDTAYAAVSHISWPGMQYRSDIARDAATGGTQRGI